MTITRQGAVRAALAFGVALALLLAPSLWPFVAAGASLALLAGLWLAGRGRLAAAVLAAACAAAAVAVAGIWAVDDEDPGLRPGIGGDVELVARYAAHLTLSGTRELRVQETLAVAAGRGAGARRAARALAAAGWRSERLPDGRLGYVRASRRTADVPGLLPAQRTNSFAAPVLAGTGVRVILDDRSRVVIDSPPRAIGETFPGGTAGPGPGDRERITLPLPEFGEPVEFDVRSPLFRNPIAAKAADVTLWTPFGVAVGIATTFINDRLRQLVTGWFARLSKRARQRRSRRARRAGARRGPR